MNYTFTVNDFEGPLDLLLHLVKESKMDIYEINIAEIIEDYLKFLHTMEEMNIDVASEYLTVASDLIYLKSKLLVGRVDEEETSEFELNSLDDLKQRIIEYEKYKNLSADFREMEEKRSEVFTKLPESLKEYADDEMVVNQSLTINDLLNAFLDYRARAEETKPLKTKISKKELSVHERISNIRSILKIKKKINFLELFEEVTREYVVITLISLLEMAKNNEILMTQKQNFSPIMIEVV